MRDHSICLKSADGKHEPNLHTVRAEFDGTCFYIDVSCSHCGETGCMRMIDISTAADETNWD